MQTSPEVVFQGMTGSAQIQDAIEKHIAELEQRWGRITACRVVVKGPGQRHHKGGAYDVHIRLSLPDGREVNVERTPPADERYADLTFALDNAFKRARRQLQDEVRRTQNQVKHHDDLPVATVVRLDPSGEFGFLEASDGQEVYFHRNSVLDNAFPRLAVGSRVTFTEEAGDKGAQATTVRLLGKHKLRS
jgi:cold shock CspA family protein/ribosome-associated translation inhibitor RaiA